MLNFLANTFMTAARLSHDHSTNTCTHWADGTRFDNRRNAELEAHTTGRRRD